MYQQFAHYYDLMMDTAPYEEWTQYIIDKVKTYLKQPSNPSLVLDLGCGTGELTLRLAKAGFDMIGLDLSEEMLQVAREKTEDNVKKGEIKEPILYLQQDMREMALFGSVDLIVSMCDSLNYLTSEADFKQTLEKAWFYLNPGGLMIFDLNTAYKFAYEIGDETFAENFEGFSYIWENYFDDEKGIHEYALTLFVEEEKNYKKYEEFHYEYVFTKEQVCSMIHNQGFELLEMNGDMGASDMERASKHYYIIRKN